MTHIKKYKLRHDLFIILDSNILYRIEALRDFRDVFKGELGGYVESEDNLSQEGGCWIYDNAKVFGNAHVSGDAYVYNDARVFGNAQVYEYAEVFKDARVYGNAKVFGYAYVGYKACMLGNATVCGFANVSHRVCLFGYAYINRATVIENRWIYGPNLRFDYFPAPKDNIR